MLALTLTLNPALIIQLLGAAILIGVLVLTWRGKRTDTTPTNNNVLPALPKDEKVSPSPSQETVSVYDGPDAVATVWASIKFIEGWATHNKHSKVLEALTEVRRDLFVADTPKSNKKAS